MAALFNWEKILEEERRKRETEARSIQNAQKENEARQAEAQKKDLRTRTVEMNRRRAEEDDTYAPARVSREAYDALRDGSYTSAQSAAPKKRSTFAEDVAARQRTYELQPKVKTLFGTKPATVFDLLERPEDVTQPTLNLSNSSDYKTLMNRSQTRQQELLNRINKATANPVFDSDYLRNGSTQESVSQLRKDYQTEVQYYNQLKQNRAKALIKENTPAPDYSVMQNPGSTWTKEDVEAKAFYDGMMQKVKDGSYTKEDYDDIVFLLNNTSGPMKTWVQKTFNEVPKFDILSRTGELIGGAVNRTIGNIENAFSGMWANDVNSSAKRNQARKEWEAESGQTGGLYHPYRNSNGELVTPPLEIMPAAGLLRKWDDASNAEQYPNGVQSTTESLYTKRADESYQRGSYGLSPAGQFVYNAGSAIAGALTDAGAAALTGASPNAMMALSAGGQAYQDALNEGKTTDEAFAYGAIWGGLVSAMNKVLGGIEITGANAKMPAWIQNAAKRVSQKPATSTAVKYIYNAMQEGGEEYLEEILEPVVRNIAFDENNEFQPFTQQALEAGLIGAISAGAINALELPGNYRTARAESQNRTVIPANRASVDNASTAAQQRIDTAVQNAQLTNADKNKDLIPTDSADAGPVSTAPESSSSLNLTIPPTLPDVTNTEAAGQKANETPSPIVQNESDATASNNSILENAGNFNRESDLEQARSVIGDYAKRGGIDVRWYSDRSRPDKADTNGFYENGAIYINENAENPYMEVFKHELFHALSESDKRAVTDFFRKNVNENTQAFQDYKMRTMQANRRKNLRYSDADFWEEYTAQNAEFLLDEAWIERLAQTDKNLAQRILDWIRRAIQRIGDLFSAPKDYSAEVTSHESGRVSGLTDEQLRKAQRLYERALNGTREAGSETRYSIETLPDGKRYVQADRQVITSDNPDDWGQEITDYINQKIRNGEDVAIPTEDGDVVLITEKTAWKMADRHAGSTQPVGNRPLLTDSDYRTKANAAGHIDELLSVSRKSGSAVPDKQGKHAEFAKDGWQSRIGYFMDGDGQYYRMRISTAQNADGNVAYNIGQIQKRNRPARGDNSLKGSSVGNDGARAKSVSSDVDSIPQESATVNNSIRENQQNDTVIHKGKLKEAPFPDVAQRPDSNAAKGEASNTAIPQSGMGVNTSIRESVQNDTTKNSLKRSKFYDSIQQADTVADEVKQRAQDAEADYYYRQIGNDETMQKAVAEVEGDREAAGRKFLSTKNDSATTDDIAKGFVLLRQYQDAGDYDAAVDVAKKLAEVGTEKGRQVQIYSILGRLTPEGMLRYAASELERVKNTLGNSDKGRIWLKKHEKQLDLTSEEAKQISDRMERVQVMPDGRDKAVMLAEIQKLLQSKMPTSLGSKLSTLQRVSLLLNPKTVISRNALSNMLMNPIYATSDFIASGVDKAIGKKTGLRTIAAPNYKEQAKGWKKGAFESYDDFRRAINTRDIQANRYEIGNKLDSGPAFKGKNPLSKAVAFLDRTTGFLLDVGDRPFFEGYFLESLNGQMRANKTDTPTPDMIDIATQTALEKTWQDDNAVTRSASKIKNALNFGRDFGIGSIVVPFVKTPSNIAKAIVDFSPAGFAKAITADAYNFTKAVKNGTATAQMQNKLAKNIGKGMAGVLLYAAGLALAANGITTGSDDEKDKDIRNYKRNILGINPYSIKIGDQTFTYDWSQPIGSVLSITADLNRNKINMDNAANIIANALATGGNTLFEQSMLSGLSELFGGYDGFIPAVADAVLDMPSQFVPTLSKQIAELTDPYVRRTATGESTDRAVNKVLARIPGASKTLEPAVDVLGRDVKRYGGKNNLFNVFLNPANVNIANPTKETEEIWRLYEETGDAGVFPKTAPTSFTYDGTSYSLTAKEQTQFQRVMGQETEKGLQELFSEKVYDNPKSSKQYRKSTAKDKADKTDEQVRADLVKDIIDEAYETAKKDMLKRRGVVVKDKK